MSTDDGQSAISLQSLILLSIVITFPIFILKFVIDSVLERGVRFDCISCFRSICRRGKEQEKIRLLAFFFFVRKNQYSHTTHKWHSGIDWTGKHLLSILGHPPPEGAKFEHLVLLV